MPDMMSKRTARAYTTDVDAAPAYWMIGICWRLLATGVQTGGSFCLADQLVPPGTGPRMHVHPQDEGLYVASGRCIFNAGGEVLDAGRGSFINIPRHNEHSFTVEEDTRLINFYMPAGFDVWLMGAAIPAGRNDEPPPPGSPQPPPALIQKLGFDYVGGRPHATESSTLVNPIATPPSRTSVQSVPLFAYDTAAWAVLADGVSTGGSYCMFEVLMPRGRAETAHVHEDTDEIIYVLDGEIEISLDGARKRVGTSGMAFIPRGTVHSYRAESPTVRILDIYTSPGFERMVERFGGSIDAFALGDPGTSAPPASGERRAVLFSEIGLREI